MLVEQYWTVLVNFYMLDFFSMFVEPILDSAC